MLIAPIRLLILCSTDVIEDTELRLFCCSARANVCFGLLDIKGLILSLAEIALPKFEAFYLFFIFSTSTCSILSEANAEGVLCTIFGNTPPGCFIF